MPMTSFKPFRAKSAWGWLFRRLCLATGSIIAADWLIFTHIGSLSLVVFLATLGIMTVCAHPLRARWKAQILAGVLLAAGVVSLINDFNPLSFFCGVTCLTASAIILTSRDLPTWPALVDRAVLLPLSGPIRLVADLLRVCRSRRKRGTPFGLSFAVTWIAPIVLFSVFLVLLADANPVIEFWLRSIDFRMSSGQFDPRRIVFWIVILLLTWPLLHIRSIVKRSKPKALTVPGKIAGKADILFGAAAILRSLALFNALFAVQSTLDLAYLWAGVKLPAGMTYADYAHRGAYPLMATALLAAAIVLIAMRRGGPGESSRPIRTLVLIWTAQNVLLVISSILRLDLYVAIYSLTYWRIAALIWMALVAVGLALIFVQILRRKSGWWLISSNAATLAITLYACSLINFPEVIARYNFAHSRDAGGAGESLDIGYLVSLGPYALPVIDQLPPARMIDMPGWSGPVSLLRTNLVTSYRRTQQDWRSWSVQAWRLSHYLDMKGAEQAAAAEIQPKSGQ